MIVGEYLQERIYKWIRRNYPDGATWYDGPAAKLPPIEIRVAEACGMLEGNIINGGWAQFLWNCFDHWRAIIDTAKEGYLLIGAREQSEALDELRTLCKRYERECRRMRKLSEKDFRRYFGEFMSHNDDAPFDREELFYNDSGMYERRTAWLKVNEARIVKFLRQPQKKKAVPKKRKVPKKRAVKKPVVRKKR